MKSFYLKIAGFQVRVNFINVTNEAFRIPPQYWPFALIDYVDDDKTNLYTINIDNGYAFPELGEEIGQFDATGNNQAVYKQPNGKYLFDLSDSNGQRVCRMLSDEGFKTNTVALEGDLTQYTFGFNNAMMIAFSFSSATAGTLLMHSSVTLYKGGAYMFLGKSGTGKSTHSSLWLKHFSGTELLNDDNPVMRVEDGRVIVYGTPWSGKTPCYKNQSAPVQALVMLEQKPYNRIQRVRIVNALAYLLTSCSSMIWDKPTYHAIISTLSAVIARVPVYHLECLPDEAAARLSRVTLTHEDQAH